MWNDCEDDPDCTCSMLCNNCCSSSDDLDADLGTPGCCICCLGCACCLACQLCCDKPRYDISCHVAWMVLGVIFICIGAPVLHYFMYDQESYKMSLGASFLAMGCLIILLVTIVFIVYECLCCKNCRVFRRWHCSTATGSCHTIERCRWVRLSPVWTCRSSCVTAETTNTEMAT